MVWRGCYRAVIREVGERGWYLVCVIAALERSSSWARAFSGGYRRSWSSSVTSEVETSLMTP